MNAVREDALQFPLKLTLTAMSERTRAQIEYYIEHSDDSFFSIAGSTEIADVVIVDHDHPGTAARLDAGEWRSDAALLVLAGLHKPVHGAIILSKPFDSAALEQAAHKTLQQLNDQVDRPVQTQITRDDLALPKLTQRAEKAPPERTETPTYFRTIDAALPGPHTLTTMTRIERYRAKIDLLCGPARSLEQLRDPADNEHRVELASCLSQTIAAVVFGSDPSLKAAQIKLPDADIFILPTLNKVYTSVSLEYKRNVNRVFKDWNDSEVTILKYDQANVNDVIDTLNRTPRYAFSAHSFCWLSSLFCAQGRLPTGFDIDTVCRLRHWPNITRLELIPDCLEIAAAWSEQSATLPQIVGQVRCEPRHAVSLFNAACTIGVMTIEDTHD